MIKKILAVSALIIIMGASVIACSSPSTKQAETPETTEAVETTTKAEEIATTEIAIEATETEIEDNLFSNEGIIETDDYAIKITEYKVIQPGEEGNEYGDAPVIAFWYETTNTSGNEIDPSSAWIYCVKAIQDNDPNIINELNVGTLPDSRFIDSQMSTIKEGGTLENAMSYILTDTTTPVTLTATNGMFGESLGEKIFELNQ